VQAYIIAQLFGGIVGGALVYANYFHAIDIVEGGRSIRTLNTAGLFATYPVGILKFPAVIQLTFQLQLEYMTGVSAFFSELLCTAFLMISILAMIDKQNTGPPKGLAPLIIFITFVAISVSLGMETSRFFCFTYF
jgi:aquaglyceroporin related protein